MIDKFQKLMIKAFLILSPLIYFFNLTLYYMNKPYLYNRYDRAYTLWIFLPVFIIIYIYKAIKKEIKIGLVDYIIYFLALITIISTFTSLDIYYAIFGIKGRMEGLLSLLFYYVLFLNVINIKDKKFMESVISIIIIIGLFNVYYSILQVYTDFPRILRSYNEFRHMGSGILGNPNFCGSYMAMTSILSICLYLFQDKRKKFYLISGLLLFVGILLCNSSGPFLGFGVAFFYLIMYYGILKRKNLKKIVKLSILLVLIYGLQTSWSNYLFKHVYNYRVMEAYTISGDLEQSFRVLFRIKKDSKEKLETIEDMGSDRINIWDNSLKVAQKYPWLGTGPDCFGLGYLEVRTDYTYTTRAHNVYLQTLCTLGIFGFISSIALIVVIFIKGLKLKNVLGIALFVSFCAYSVQAFFNINTVYVTPTYYLICGFIISLSRFKEDNVI